MFWKLEAEKYSVHTNLCPLATEILAPCGYTLEWYSHADFNKDLNISPICRIKAPQYCVLLKCIICVANWKLSRQSKCHKKMTLLCIGERVWTSLLVTLQSVHSFPECSSRQQTSVVPATLVDHWLWRGLLDLWTEISHFQKIRLAISPETSLHPSHAMTCSCTVTLLCNIPVIQNWL